MQQAQLWNAEEDPLTRGVLPAVAGHGEADGRGGSGGARRGRDEAEQRLFGGGQACRAFMR